MNFNADRFYQWGIDSLNAANLGDDLTKVCAYAFDGGKRVRPRLVWASFLGKGGVQDFDSAPKDARAAMLACEFLHVYSLIHDDLPCMDDDDMRRGRASCHKVFGEALALLAGDALHAHAFCVLAPHAHLLPIFADGARAMVKGQAVDFLGRANHLDALKQMHAQKTGALIKSAVMMGAFCGDGADLSAYADDLGLAFQVQDDVLGATATTQKLGKTAGIDEKNARTTFVGLLGVDGARQYADELLQRARTAVADRAALLALTDWLCARDC